MIKKNLVVANGSYQTANGEEKTRWVTVGALHEHNGKDYITLDAHINLAGLERKEGDTRVFANLFDPKERGAGAGASAGQPFDDKIPF